MVKVLLYVLSHHIKIEVFIRTLVFKLLEEQVHTDGLNCTEPLSDLAAKFLSQGLYKVVIRKHRQIHKMFNVIVIDLALTMVTVYELNKCLERFDLYIFRERNLYFDSLDIFSFGVQSVLSLEPAGF